VAVGPVALTFAASTRRNQNHGEADLGEKGLPARIDSKDLVAGLGSKTLAVVLWTYSA
jgi:hypothetical protein